MTSRKQDSAPTRATTSVHQRSSLESENSTRDSSRCESSAGLVDEHDDLLVGVCSAAMAVLLGVHEFSSSAKALPLDELSASDQSSALPFALDEPFALDQVPALPLALRAAIRIPV